MSKRAIILAGGKGTRLRPYTLSLPKPLVPVADKPIIQIIIEQLIKNGFDHITLTINHMAEVIKAFCGDGSRWGAHIDYSLEDKPLGTMAPLKIIKDLPDNFLVMNGDVLTDLNFKELYDAHLLGDNIFTISSFQRENINDYGVLDVKNGTLINFREKPLTIFEVSMGVYILNKKVLDYIPANSFYGFDQLMLSFLKKDEKVKVIKHVGYWLDIGRPDDYQQANEDYEKILGKLK